MVGRRVPEKGCTCVGRLVWSTITVVESSSRSLRPQISQARRTDRRTLRRASAKPVDAQNQH